MVSVKRLRHWSCSRPTLSPAALMMLQAGYDPTGSSWTPPSPRSFDLLPVDALISCRSYLLELALTKSRQPLSSVTSAFISTLTSLWGHTRHQDRLCLLHCTASAKKHSPIRPQIRFPVAGNVSRFVTTGSRKCNPCRYSAVPAQASPVGNEPRCPAGVYVVEVRPHHSSPSQTSLVEVGREDWLQACCPCLQVSAGSSTVVSCWWTSWVGGFRGTMSTTFRLVVIASHPSYAVINRRWPSFSSCCGSCLEQSTAARHIRAVTASLPQSPP